MLLTDEKTVARLAKGVARVRCAACGEIHLLARKDSPARPAPDMRSSSDGKSETPGQTGL